MPQKPSQLWLKWQRKVPQERRELSCSTLELHLLKLVKVDPLAHLPVERNPDCNWNLQRHTLACSNLDVKFECAHGCAVECMSASPIVEEIDISGSGAYISSKIVESSLRKLLGRASGRSPTGRDLPTTNTADTRKVSTPRWSVKVTQLLNTADTIGQYTHPIDSHDNTTVNSTCTKAMVSVYPQTQEDSKDTITWSAAYMQG